MTLSIKYPKTFNNLQTLLFPDEYSQYHFSIAKLALIYLNNLEEQFINEFPERQLVIEWLSEEISGDESTIQLSIEIKKSRKLIKQFLLAFLTTMLPPSSISHDKRLYDSYKPLTLSVVIQLILKGTHESAYQKICNEMRMFANGRRNDLSRYLPIIKQQHLLKLNAELDKQRKNTSDESLLSISAQIARYQVPYDAVALGKEEILKAPSTKKERKKINLSSKSVNDVDTAGNLILEITEQYKGGKTRLSYEHEEKNSTPLDIKLLNVVLKEQTTEPRANYLLATCFSQRMIVRKLKLPTQKDILTKRTIQITNEYCLKNENDIGAQLLLLILSTGLKPEELNKIKFKSTANSISYYRKHILPSYEQTPEFRKYIPNVKQQTVINLPTFIKPFNGVSILDALPQAKTIISSLNKRYNSFGLTIERLRLNLRAWLINHSVDSAITGFLCGDELKQQPGMYYTLLDHKCITETYQHYLSDTFPQCTLPMLSNENEVNIGSNLPVYDHVISKQLHEIKKVYLETQDIIQQHFYLAIYTYYIVALFSGYRPVSAMLGYFDDINFITGLYTISDKENRLGISSRNIVLPQIAIKQLLIYKESLEYISKNCIYTHKIFSNRCKSALSIQNSNPWLVFIFNDEIIEPNPGALNNVLRKFFPMANNWHRHWARSKLREFNVHQDITDAWIGHSDIGQEGFGRFSNLSYVDLKNVANLFDKKAQNMGVTDING